MAFGAIAPALIAGIAALGGSIYSAISNRKAAKSANRTNLTLADRQNQANERLQDRQFTQNQQQSELEYQRNLELLQMQNEYNSPENQIKRYTSAGLNPNLIYGSGSASAGNQSTPGSYTAARYESPRAERVTVNPTSFDAHQTVAVAQQIAMNAAQVDQTKAQTEFTRQETKNNAINNLIKAEELTGRRLSNREKESLIEPTVMGAYLRNQETINRTNLLSEQTNEVRNRVWNLQPLQQEKLANEIINLRATADLKKFDLELNRIGINSRDPLWSRLGIRLLTAGDNEVSEFIRNLFKRK